MKKFKINEEEKKNLYPEEKTPLKEHYSDFDSVYIGLLPFIELEKTSKKASSSKKIISFKEAQEENELFKKLKDHSNMTIYSSSDDYPTVEEIMKNGRRILWKEIIEYTTIQNEKELNKALMTSIGAYKKKLQRPDLLNHLNSYTERNNIWHPTEGRFGQLTKISIYRSLKSAKIKTVIIEDEYREQKKSLELSNITESDFCKNIGFKDYYIYTENKSILFSIDWDFFFFFIAIKEDTFSRLSIEELFEGFWANEKDNHLWTWEEGEIDRLLNEDEKKGKKLVATMAKTLISSNSWLRRLASTLIFYSRCYFFGIAMRNGGPIGTDRRAERIASHGS